ncbi:MAG: hypothetical protein IJ111_02510 [Eggerthellaceae bacterium]|nr:hypothetical protein [Eggerthellaceae bacterium]
MRSTDERMNEVLSRARTREVASRRKWQRAVAIGGGALSIVVVAVAGLGFASASGAGISHSAGSLGLMGNVLSGGSALGYIVVGLLGLLLGVAVTVLTFKLGRSSHGSKHADGTGRARRDGVIDGRRRREP